MVQAAPTVPGAVRWAGVSESSRCPAMINLWIPKFMAGLPPGKFSNSRVSSMISQLCVRRVQSSLRGQQLRSPHVGVRWLDRPK